MLGLGALGAAGLSAAGGRARHLALPVLSDPSLPPPAPSPLPEAPPCAVRELGRVPARPTALLRARDGLWVGTFDQGAWRIAGDAAQEVPGLEGRERFVNALGEVDGLVWAGTQRGAIGFRGVAVTALAPARGGLVAGTARGVALLSRAGTRTVALEGAAGDLRVTSLAV